MENRKEKYKNGIKRRRNNDENHGKRFKKK